MTSQPTIKKPTPRAALIDHVARRIAAFHLAPTFSDTFINNVVEAAFYNKRSANAAGYASYKQTWLDFTPAQMNRFRGDIIKRTTYHQRAATPAPPIY